MKRMFGWPVLAALAGGVWVALMAAGCESSSSSSLSIDPQAVTLVAADTPSATFTVSGGTPPYAWSVDNPGLGSLSAVAGAEVVYTATANVGQNVLRVEDAEARTSTSVIEQM